MEGSLPLPELFSICSNYFDTIILSESSTTSDNTLEEMIQVSELAKVKVREEAMFSKGETIDEHPTSSLKVSCT